MNETLIVSALKSYEAGKSVTDICCEIGLNKQTFQHWNKQYGSMETPDLKRPRELEQKFAQLQKMYADLVTNNKLLKDVISEKFLSPSSARTELTISVWSIGIASPGLANSSTCLRHCTTRFSKKDNTEVINKLSELAEKKSIEGQDKFYCRIRNAGIKWNHNRIERAYKMMGLNKRNRTRKVCLSK